MKSILIIGNGFDLYHGLPTKYTDFLFFAKNWMKFKEEYDRQDSVEDDETRMAIEVRLGSRNELTLESLSDFAKNAHLFSKEKINFINDHIQNNAWLTYFDKITLPNQNWIDFESEIYKALLQVESYYCDILPSTHSRTPMSYMPDSMRTVIYTFSPKAEQSKYGYKNLAGSVLRNNNSDPEKLKTNKLALLQSMKDELDALNRCLCYYLLEFVSAIKIDVISEQIKSLGEVYLLNFNYTYTYAAVYGKEALLEHHPVHGEANEENLVLGIPDDSFQDTLDYIYFQKFFQRIQKKTGNYYKKWISKEEHYSSPTDCTQVIIMGHSLNRVDKGILEHFFMEKNVKSIKIFYHDQNSYENQVISLVDMFGKDFVIDQTGRERIIFEKLAPPIDYRATVKEC